MASSARRLFLWSVFAPVLAFGAEVEGVRLEDRIRLGGQELRLNGAGLRTRFIFSVYVAGLYLPEKAQSGRATLAMKGPKRMAMVMMRDVTAAQFSEALLASLRNNVAEAELAALKPQVDDLIARIAQIGEVKKGAHIDLDYLPKVGTTLRVNDRLQGAPIEGEALFRALLLTWVGAKPSQPDLKRSLLGQGG